MKYAGLRVDIDGVKDAELLPLLLDMLKRQGIKATFFVTSGRQHCLEYETLRQSAEPHKTKSIQTVWAAYAQWFAL